MGPQLYRCGNVQQHEKQRIYDIASMGPQLYRCGNNAMKIAVQESKETLQWGRNFIVAETAVQLWQGPAYGKLQWGRNFIVAETLRMPA